MPKKLGSADLPGIYGDPDRAKAEAEADLAKAVSRLDAMTRTQARTGVFLGSLILRADLDRKNADFKLKRANAAIALRDVETTPVLWGWSPAQLKIGIVAGLIAAGFLFFG